MGDCNNAKTSERKEVPRKKEIPKKKKTTQTEAEIAARNKKRPKSLPTGGSKKLKISSVRSFP